TGLGIEDSELRGQLTLDVSQHRERQVLQLVLLTTPGQVHELAVDADTENLRVTGLEFLIELAERGNLGRAHEREVLGPEEYDLPLALEAVLGERLERALQVAGNYAGEGKLGKFLSNAQH